jgi:hypothetical protein
MGLPMVVYSESGGEKGPVTYQLYSWKGINGDWNFCLLHDTNRQKTVAEVFNPKATLKGVERLKRKLSDLPEGSRLIWFDRLTVGGNKVKGSETLSYPPNEVVVQVRHSAQSRNIEIVGAPNPIAQ